MSLPQCPIPVLCDIWSFIEAIPRLALVCKKWKEMTEDEHVWQLIASSMPHVTDREDLSMKEYWEQNFLHRSWKASPENLIVDFESSRIPNQNQDEEQSSQMYYTFPRVGLQFKTKFTLYSIETCTDIERVALKNGCHLGTRPCIQSATYLATGLANDTIVKLDFSVNDKGETNVVVWTASAIELFVIPPGNSNGLTTSERERRDTLNPMTKTSTIASQGELGPDRKVLLIHIHDEGNIGMLTTKTSTGLGMLHIFNFNTKKLIDEAIVPSIIRTEPSIPTGEWKSRERGDFKGSGEIAALIDDSGVIQVYHYAAQMWCECHAQYFNPSNQKGPRPKLLRTCGPYVLFWNNSGGSGNDPAQNDSANTQLPFYVEVHHISHRKDPLGDTVTSKRVLSECYTSISSAYVDLHRCYISAALPNNDMFVDVWDHQGRFISRVHSVNNAWTPQKQYTKIYISKIFWTYSHGLTYVELALDSQKRNINMAFRQVLSVPKLEYWKTCTRLKNGGDINKETHEVSSSTRQAAYITDVYPGRFSADFKARGIRITKWAN